MGKLIEKENKFYKECGVIMLGTNDYTSVGLVHETNRLYYLTGREDTYDTVTNLAVFQHLYITSDDEIKESKTYWKEGTWFLDIFNTPRQATNKTIISPNDKKIISSTDPSLGLSSPSDKFIQVYIEAYNQGNPIEKVLVEYEMLMGDDGIVAYSCGEDEYKLKFKGNNIIIKKVKDSWTRDEMEQKCLKALSDGLFYGGRTKGKVLWSDYVKNWMDENL